MNQKELDKLAVSAIRATCIDVVNKAKSGHPGMALGSAPILYTLFSKHLVANPKDPLWINRDRFILSAGHASSLLYTMLHVSGYRVSLDDLKSFRQLGSLTPGHPEYKHTEGVDATSGPLGQGIAQAVGVAMAERATAAQYKDGEKLINHYTYALCGDGCLQEGLSQEAISLAGHHRLNKLILIYDSNNVTLDGGLDLSFSEDVKHRFLASGWDVLEVNDGNDIEAIDKAITKAKDSKDKPTLIIVKTVIGYGSEKQGTSKVHGNPLGEEDGAHAKAFYGYNYPAFTIPEEVYNYFKDTFAKRGEKAEESWKKVYDSYAKAHKDEIKVFEDAFTGNVSSYVGKEPEFAADNADSSRVASGKALNDLHSKVPFLMGGSADVAGSVMTKITDGVNFTKETPSGRNINFGIREFAMAAAQNGMLLHGGVKTYVGAFLVFADYMKAAIRMAALSKLPAFYLFSHDSIAVGEDGPTHQPIETLAMLRSIPNVNVIRPCDSRETYAAWKIALESKETPTALILSRQNLPLLNSSYSDVSKGAYIISKESKKLDAILVATGSEVSLAISAQKILFEKGLDVRVVSMPSTFLFDKQSEEYKHKVLSLSKDKIISVEMLSTFGWHKYANHTYGIDTFGTSAPAKDAIKSFHFMPEDLADFVMKSIK
ncbi:MAG: transketolase [Bacilli bacterium]|nr:transketolase [Bacilli bacterium]